MVPRAVTPLSCSLPASREGATLRPSLHFNFQPFSTSLISRRREESVLCPPGKCSVEDLDIFWTPSPVSTYSKQVLAVVVVVVVEMLMLQQQNSDDQQRSHSDVATPKYFLGHQTLSLISPLSSPSSVDTQSLRGFLFWERTIESSLKISFCLHYKSNVSMLLRPIFIYLS